MLEAVRCFESLKMLPFRKLKNGSVLGFFSLTDTIDRRLFIGLLRCYDLFFVCLLLLLLLLSPVVYTKFIYLLYEYPGRP